MRAPPLLLLAALATAGFSAIQLLPEETDRLLIGESLAAGSTGTTEGQQDVLMAERTAIDLPPAVLEQPLFTATRLRFVPEAEPIEDEPEPEVAAVPVPEPEAPPEPPSDLSVHGTAYDQTPSALIQGPEGQPERWITIGDEIDGWVVQEISNGTVKLAQGNAEFTIKMSR